MSQFQSKNTIAAIVLIVTGSLLLLVQLDLLIIPWYIFTWQFLLIGIGFLLIITKNRWEAGATLMTIGSAFLFAKINHISYREMWHYWPVLLILIGVIMLFRHLDEPNKNTKDNYHEQQ